MGGSRVERNPKWYQVVGHDQDTSSETKQLFKNHRPTKTKRYVNAGWPQDRGNYSHLDLKGWVPHQNLICILAQDWDTQIGIC